MIVKNKFTTLIKMSTHELNNENEEKSINDIIIVNDKILLLQRDIEKLVEMFKMVNDVVNEQSVTISRIQDSIIDISLNTEESVSNLETVKTNVNFYRAIYMGVGSAFAVVFGLFVF